MSHKIYWGTHARTEKWWGIHLSCPLFFFTFCVKTKFPPKLNKAFQDAVRVAEDRASK